MRIDRGSVKHINDGSMETLKPFMVGVAAFWPFVLCLVLTWRVVCHRPTDWKLASCVAGLSVASSLLLLLASEKLLFLRYQEAVIQVNQKAEEVSQLTEQNKRIAKATAQAIMHGHPATWLLPGQDPKVWKRYLEDLLKEAGVSRTETDEIMGGRHQHTNLERVLGKGC